MHFCEKAENNIVSVFQLPLDTNECNGRSLCHANATCNNTEGSYIISTCDPEYTGDRYMCNGMHVKI